MGRVQTIVQLNAELIASLDAAAHLAGVSRSAVIRLAIEEHLSSQRDANITSALVRGYEALPQGAADEWGDILGQSQDSATRTLQRLDAEEQAAGLTW